MSPLDRQQPAHDHHHRRAEAGKDHDRGAEERELAVAPQRLLQDQPARLVEPVELVLLTSVGADRGDAGDRLGNDTGCLRHSLPEVRDHRTNAGSEAEGRDHRQRDRDQGERRQRRLEDEHHGRRQHDDHPRPHQA